MARAIESLPSGLKVGHAGLGLRGKQAPAPGSPGQQVHDGDTVTVRALGNFAVRFLGVDAAEESFPLPGGERFISIGDQRWRDFLDDPFADDLPPFEPPLQDGLRTHLQERVGPGTAENHAEHSDSARVGLVDEVKADMSTLGQSKETFEFFLAFAHEVMDGYGRLLCYLNRAQPNEDEPEPRPPSYNERLLKGAKLAPYLIWPNIDPFRRQDLLFAAVPRPGTARRLAERTGTLRRAREWVKAARDAQTGIFDAENPLRLYPFELRFLARRAPPDRWLIDLSSDDDRLIPPQKYYTVPNIEDRLFVPSEYVPLFEKKRWKRAR